MKRRSRPQRPSAWWLKLFVLIRVFTVILGLELTGVTPAAAELVRSVACDRGSSDQCPPDGPCDDCPPSCPNCHCSNRILSLVPKVEVAAVTALLTARQLQDRARAEAPPVPDRASLFRPPCSSARS